MFVRISTPTAITIVVKLQVSIIAVCVITGNHVTVLADGAGFDRVVGRWNGISSSGGDRSFVDRCSFRFPLGFRKIRYQTTLTIVTWHRLGLWLAGGSSAQPRTGTLRWGNSSASVGAVLSAVSWGISLKIDQNWIAKPTDTETKTKDTRPTKKPSFTKLSQHLDP